MSYKALYDILWPVKRHMISRVIFRCYTKIYMSSLEKWAHENLQIGCLISASYYISTYTQVTTYPHTHKDTHTQNYTQSHIHIHTIVLHTQTAHTYEGMFRHTHTRVTQYIEEGGTRQELGELRVTAKNVVESRVSESLFIYIWILCCMMEVVIRDGLQNGSWVTNHQKTKSFSKKRRVSSGKIFFSIKSKNMSQEAEEETTSGRTPVKWSAVNR